MNIYVGNLAFSVTESDLQSAFEAHGKVDSARIIMDNHTGNSKGFGFVEMPNDAEAKAAMSDLNGKEVGGRDMKVNEAKPREDNRNSNRGSNSGSGGRGNRW